MNDLKGAIDIHVHSSPSIFPRSVNDLELAEQAKQAGMRAIVLKAHEESTVSRAKLVSKVVEGIEVYGSLVLNEYVGGLNPYAVDMAIQQGAKLIWMPTYQPSIIWIITAERATTRNRNRPFASCPRKGSRSFRRTASCCPSSMTSSI